jgi:hypothetical protein
VSNSPTAQHRKNRVRSLRLKRKTKSILFMLSILANIYAFQKVFLLSEESKKTIIITTEQSTQIDMVDRIYNLKKYKAVSKFNTSVEDRYKRLLRIYGEDQQTSKEKHYAGEEVKDQWEQHCRDMVRRIINLQARVLDLEVVLDSMFVGVDTTQLTEAIRSKGYEDKLSEMSNYYAGFLDEYSYNRIVQTTD